MRNGVSVRVEISPGELFDKLTILKIKQNKLTEPEQITDVLAQRSLLDAACRRSIKPTADLDLLTADLQQVNEALWDIEDKIRCCEAAGQFDDEFVMLARSVYKTNDRRAAIKREIDELLGAAFSEQKSHGR